MQILWYSGVRGYPWERDKRTDYRDIHETYRKKVKSKMNARILITSVNTWSVSVIKYSREFLFLDRKNWTLHFENGILHQI